MYLFKNSYFPSIKALQHAFKATFAALIALYIAFLLDLSQPHWAATTALIVAQPQAGMALSKGLTRLIGTLVGTVSAIIVMSLFAQTPWLFLLAIAVIVMFSVMFAASIRNIWSYSFMMIGITVTIILVPNMLSPNAIFDYAVERFLEISLGIISTSVIFAVLWPVKTHEILINEADKTILLGFNSAIKSMKGEALDDAFLQSLSNIITVDAQREHAAFEGQKGKNSAKAILGICQNILHILGLARSIYRDKQNLTNAEWVEIEPWITQTIEALEKGKRADLTKTYRALEAFLKQQSTTESESIHITLHRIELLLQHAIRVRRYLHSARIGKPIKLINKNALSQHRNYTLGLVFGLRSAVAFLTIAFIWYLAGWSLVNAIMPLTMSVIICSLFAGKENAEQLSLFFCKGSIYTVIISLIINTYIFPNTNNFIMLSLALGIPIFICTMMSLIPKYAIFASLPINFLMLLHPSNHIFSSTEYLLNQSVGLIFSSIIAALSIHLISINMSYWHAKPMKQLILKDITKLINRPLHNSNTWFNTRMADRLLLIAKHQDTKTDEKYNWNRAILALDLGDEIFFVRRLIKYHPTLIHSATQYFHALTASLNQKDSNISWKILNSATLQFNIDIQKLESHKKTVILQSAILQIQEIWHIWCQPNQQENNNGNA